jgi:hypothetical protein
MNKLFTAKPFAFLTVALLSTAACLSARVIEGDPTVRYEKATYYPESLRTCDTLSIEAKAGIAPTIFPSNRGVTSGISSSTPNSTLIPLTELPDFNDLFKVPFIGGGNLAYYWSERTKLFAEVNYRQAHAKSFCFTVPVTGDTITRITTIDQDKFRAIGAYFGVSYYFNCGSWAFFGGPKIGLVHYRPVNFAFTSQLNTQDSTVFTSSRVNLFGRDTVLSGGALLGFDAYMGCGVSFTVTAEVVASRGPCGNTNTALATPIPDLNITNIVVERTGSEVYFPATFGLSYSF